MAGSHSLLAPRNGLVRESFYADPWISTIEVDDAAAQGLSQIRRLADRHRLPAALGGHLLDPRRRRGGVRQVGRLLSRRGQGAVLLGLRGDEPARHSCAPSPMWRSPRRSGRRSIWRRQPCSPMPSPSPAPIVALHVIGLPLGIFVLIRMMAAVLDLRRRSGSGRAPAPQPAAAAAAVRGARRIPAGIADRGAAAAGQAAQRIRIAQDRGRRPQDGALIARVRRTRSSPSVVVRSQSADRS